MSTLQRLGEGIGKFFSLETLDTRLEAPRDLKKRQAIIQSATPSRWKTLEFRFYLACFAVVVPLMFKTAAEASNETNPNYWIYKGVLSNGWIFGRKVDNTDQQYRFFRDNFPMLIALLVVHVLSRRLVQKVAPSVSRTTFDMYTGLLVLFGLHGFNCFKILLHVTVEFFIGRLSNKNRKLSIILLWGYGIGTLFINAKYRKFKFGSLLPFLSFMDSFEGMIERWDVFFNFTLLRMLSFNLDYIAHNQDDRAPPECTKAKTSEDSIPLSETPEETTCDSDELFYNERKRLDAWSPTSDYSFSKCLSYTFYTPLFIAGPILTFNDYLFQSRNPLPSIEPRRIAIYGARLLFCILTMEFILHYIYVVVVSKAKAWYNDTPFQISMIGLFNLNIIWLKLLIPWRMFRFWALCDQIDTPENMIRCVNNNYSALQFWRAWHRSYNKFVIRYIYVPLGGSKNRLLASLAVFTFVAIWHDIELRLLIWGWAIVLFLLPEIIATQLIAPYKDKPWYRFVCGLGGVCNIWMMMLANLYGFCLGQDGMKPFLDSLLTADGIKFLLVANACLFIAVQVMFELREMEYRRGVNVKC